MKALKYSLALTVVVSVYISLILPGWWKFFGLAYAFGLIPLLELVFPAPESNLDQAEEEVVKKDRLYDYILYIQVPLQYGIVFLGLYQITQLPMEMHEIVGTIITVGMGCGALGINVAHELGHRSKKYEQGLSKALLLTSLYMHFFIEHNRGHHKNVSTPEDPASARYGENIYSFFFRSVTGGYRSAWELENMRVRKTGSKLFSWENEMVRFTLIQTLFCLLILFLFGGWGLLYFVISATIGFLFLETVNYIEHYGLQRKKMASGRYERTLPIHSWNSNHIIGRLMLFELTRHSDHHAHSGRKYQILRHFEDAPQMPTGYPGMMVISLFPPLWFWVMHRHIEKLQSQQVEIAAA